MYLDFYMAMGAIDHKTYPINVFLPEWWSCCLVCPQVTGCCNIIDWGWVHSCMGRLQERVRTITSLHSIFSFAPPYAHGHLVLRVLPTIMSPSRYPSPSTNDTTYCKTTTQKGFSEWTKSDINTTLQILRPRPSRYMGFGLCQRNKNETSFLFLWQRQKRRDSHRTQDPTIKGCATMVDSDKYQSLSVSRNGRKGTRKVIDLMRQYIECIS